MSKLILTIGFYLYTVPFFVVYLYDTAKTSLFPVILSLFPLIGYAVAKSASSGRPVRRESVPYEASSVKIVIWLSLFAYFTARIGDAVVITNNLLSGEFIRVATENAALRYQEVDMSTWGDKIALTAFIGYATALGMQNKVSKIQWLFLFIIMIIESSSLARAPTLLALTALFTEKSLNSTARGEADTVWSAHLKLATISLILFAVFFFSSYFRVAANPDALEIVFYEKIPQYTIASHYLFSTWVSENYFPSWTSGYFTFAFLYKIGSGLFNTGIPGAYEIVYTPFGYSNIYTQLRGLVSDFTILSPIILFYATGHLIGYISLFGMNWGGYFLSRTAIYMYLYFIISPFYFAVSTAGFMYPFLCVMILKSFSQMRRSN